MKYFKRQRDVGLFDQNIRLTKLSQLGDPLVKLNGHIDFEISRAILTEKLHKEPKGKGGRHPYEYVLIFKVLIFQPYYKLSDEQVDFQINDRMSFVRFLGLTIADDIPDSRTVWNFKEQLADTGAVEALKKKRAFFGYKNHVESDLKSKLVSRYKATDASVHDSQPLKSLLGKEKDSCEEFFADSA